MENNSLPVKLVSGLLAIPGAKINRQEFLEQVLLPYVVSKEKLEHIENVRPWAFVSQEALDKIANERVAYRKKLVTTASFFAGIPGGFGMLATIPGDLLQYNYHLLVLAQELAYLYGFPEFYDEKGEATEETVQALVIMFFGMQMAVGHAGREGVEQLIKMLAKGAPQRIATMKWGNTALFHIIQEIAKWLGINGGKLIGKKHIANAVGKAIPFIGGVISGGLSYGTFTMDSNRFLAFLRGHKELFIEADKKRNGGGMES